MGFWLSLITIVLGLWAVIFIFKRNGGNNAR